MIKLALTGPIKDFVRGRQPPREEGGAVLKPIIRPNIPGNCMKMKKIEPRGGGELPKFVYVDQPLIETYIALRVVVNVSVIFI